MKIYRHESIVFRLYRLKWFFFLQINCKYLSSHDMQCDSFRPIGVRQVFKFFSKIRYGPHWIYNSLILCLHSRIFVVSYLESMNTIGMFSNWNQNDAFTFYSLIVLCNLFSIHQKIFSSILLKNTQCEMHFEILWYFLPFSCADISILLL